ncbi:hypothetical protein [Sodalinema gerasimenkoae]|nr:hypothetical protein [Sodalinema gerasimenkoae]
MGYVILPGSEGVLSRLRPIKPLILAVSCRLRSQQRASALACQRG